MMIGLAAHDGVGAVDLLDEKEADHLMGEGHLGEGYLTLGGLINAGRESVGPSDEEDEALGYGLHLLLQVLTELSGSELSASLVQKDEDIAWLEALKEHVGLSLFLLLLAEVLDILEVGELLDAEGHIVSEATLIVGDGLLGQLANGLAGKDDVELHELRR